MNTDAVTVTAVLSWTFGLLGMLFTGLVMPFFLLVIPDAVVALRREGDRKPLVQMSALAAGSAVLGIYFISRGGAVGTPSVVVWATLAILLAVAALTAFAPMTLLRSLGRRRAQRARDRLLDEPLMSDQPLARIRPKAPPPIEEPLHWRQAEFLAADWMRHLGAVGVEVTPERRDGGVDVVSSDAFAQVKCWERDLIGVDVVRQLVGVTAPRRRRALFFSTTGFTADAVKFARDTNTALFVMRPKTGNLVPIGPLAHAVFRDGLHPEQPIALT